MTKKREIIIGIVLFIALVSSMAIWLGWSGSTKDIVGVADQFKPYSSWVLVSSHAVPPRTLCLGDDGACPSISRYWTVKTPITSADQFKKIAVIKNTNMTLLSECFYINTAAGRQDSSSCDASITLDGYKFLLSYYGTDNPGTINLRVEKS